MFLQQEVIAKTSNAMNLNQAIQFFIWETTLQLVAFWTEEKEIRCTSINQLLHSLDSDKERVKVGTSLMEVLSRLSTKCVWRLFIWLMLFEAGSTFGSWDFSMQVYPCLFYVLAVACFHLAVACFHHHQINFVLAVQAQFNFRAECKLFHQSSWRLRKQSVYTWDWTRLTYDEPEFPRIHTNRQLWRCILRRIPLPYSWLECVIWY